MASNQPLPEKKRLWRSPLALVVCQVRFEELPSATESRVMLAIHGALGGRHGPYPNVESVDLNEINIPLSSPAVLPPLAKRRQGWRLRSTDRSWQISLMPNYVSLETTKYTTWEDEFRPRLEVLLDAVASHIEPALEQRLGLRYVNRIVEPEVSTPCELRDFIVPEVLGLIVHPAIGGMVTKSQQHFELDTDEGTHVTLRHGLFPNEDREGAPSYLLDFDIFRQGVQAFDVGNIQTAADSFNGLALQLFQQSLTPKMLTYLEGDDANSSA